MRRKQKTNHKTAVLRMSLAEGAAPSTQLELVFTKDQACVCRGWRR